MTTNLILAIILAIVSCLPSCGSLSGANAEQRITDLARRVDANNDGRITNAEVKGSAGDYGLWIGLGSLVLGALGFGKAQQSSSAAKLAQDHVDDLHDKLTQPVSKA